MHAAAGTVLKGLAAGVVFAVALGAGAVLHVDLPVMRRVIVDRVNRSLATILVGRVRVEHVDRVGLTEVTGLDARVDDRAGHELLRLDGVRARLSTLAFLRALLGRGDLVVELPEIAADHAEVDLDADEDGTLRIVRAFTTSSPASAGPSRGVRLKLSRIRVAHTSIHGTMSGAPPLDAEVDDLDGSVVVSPGSLEIHADRLRLALRKLPGGATAQGAIEAHLAEPSPRGGDRALHVSWRGTVGSIAETAALAYDAGEIEATLDVPEAKPEDLRGLWPGCPFVDPASLHANGRGTLRQLRVDARASVGRSVLEIGGPVSVADDVRADLHATVQSLDAHAIHASAPATALDASANLSVIAKATGAVSGRIDLDLADGTVASMRVPPARAQGQFGYDPATPEDTSASATVTIREPGVSLDAALRLTPKKPAYDLSFDVSATASLDALSRFERMSGNASARVHGRLDAGAGRIDARIDADARDLAVPGAHLGTANLAVRATGSPSRPTIDATLTGAHLDVGGLRFATVHADAHGPPTDIAFGLALVADQGDVDAHADLAIDPEGGTLRNVVASIRSGGEHVVASAPLVRLAKREIRADDAAVEGLGAALRATARKAPDSLYVRATSTGLDLGRVARFAHVGAITAGRLALDVDAEVRTNAARGRAKIDLSGVDFEGWNDGSAHLDATVDGRRVSGRLTAALGDVGTVDIRSSSLEVPGGAPLGWSSWKQAWGAVDATAHVDLAQLAAQLSDLPLGDVGGAVDVQARLERDSITDNTPEIDVTASTTHFLASGGKPPKPWRIEGVDAGVRVHVDGDTGATSFEADAKDAAGILASLTASSDSVPYARIFETDDRVLDVVRAMPFRARLAIPDREVDRLPSVLRTKGAHGVVAGTIDWNGTLLEPTIDASVTVREGRTDASVFSLPTDVAMTAHYMSPHGDATLSASGQRGRFLEASAHVDAAAADIVDRLGRAPLPWSASLKAKLSRFPVQTIGAFDVRQISGHATGDLTIDRLHDDASGKISLAFDDLRIGDVACRDARLQATADGHAMEASAKIQEEEGSAEVHARAGAHWGQAMMPSIDPSRPSELSLTAQQLRAELLLPFTSGVFSELDGRMTGDVRVQIDPATKTIRPQGAIALKGGTFELAKLGGEFHDAAAKIVLTPDGVVKLEDATARGLSGRIEAAATARLDGLALGGARAVVQIPSRQAMPLVFDGVQVGIVDGRFDIAADRAVDGRGMDVTVDIPQMHVQLPTAASHDVQSLGVIEGVDVGVRHGPNEFVPATLDAATDAPAEAASDRGQVKVAVRLGNDVEVHRGTDLDMRLEGDPAVVLGSGEPRATGQIRLVRGTLDVEGKRFDIQGGSTVTFVGNDATNPQVVLTAGWTAPDGTNVFADFVGPLKTGKVVLRSQPSRSQSEILALILFGTTDEQAPSGTSPQAAGAVGAAGGAATAPINRALGGVNQMLDRFGLAGGISTKIDTSTTSPRPEVELQIAKDISLQIAWVLGVPPPGSNPDSTLVTLNWRFLRQLSLVTTVGDMGTSIVDVIWQRRY